MDSRYNHKDYEDKIYNLWLKSGLLKSKTPNQQGESKKPFCIIMPPPNANDPLHVGHAMFVAIEDTLVRYHRMRGYEVLWLPGTDHAGIETQFVFEKKLQKEGKSRFNFDRNTLYNMIYEYVLANSGIAIDQMKKLGASADWDKYRFTLDRDIVEQVQDTFISMSRDGLIYRDLQLVNYCTKCGTSYSDLEVVQKESTSTLYYLKYGPLTVATTRPETTFGDEALAVNPSDERYTKYIDKEIVASGAFGKKVLRVIADDFVDQNFGSGVVKITPAHDHNDFLVGKKHGLPITQVIDFSGKMTNVPREYIGLNTARSREMVVNYLKNNDLIEKIDIRHSNSVGVCYRCGRSIEPLPLPQFFLSVNHKKNSLTKKAISFLNKKETTVYGAGKEKILRHWLNNLRDWNLSRQIAWGISIPVWYKTNGHEDKIIITMINKDNDIESDTLDTLLLKHSFLEINNGLQSIRADNSVPYVVSKNIPDSQNNWLPDTDTLDTWFSSSQWPVVTLRSLGEDHFEYWYPTAIMETAYDILPFWVMRMMLMCGYLANQTPFKEIYFHGLIRDSRGQKMSKSKGNVINPIGVIDQYGADSLRMALVIRSTAGQDKNASDQEFKAMRNLTNKLWNTARYINLQQTSTEIIKNGQSTSKLDDQFNERIHNFVDEITQLMEQRQIGLAADRLYNEFWHWFCDICIENHKSGLQSTSSLSQGLFTFVKLFHPFVPYVTEAIWQELTNLHADKSNYLASASWPTKRRDAEVSIQVTNHKSKP